MKTAGWIDAPFTSEQVRALNDYQTGGRGHPFTCGNRGDDRHAGTGGVLVADATGWWCPICGYTQSWAHESMTR